MRPRQHAFAAPLFPGLIELAAGRPAIEPDDPAAFCAQAKAHRMQGLAWSAVERGELRLDVAHRHELARADLTTRLWQSKLREARREIAQRIAPTGAPQVLFKGIANAERWYDRPAERPCIDLDIYFGPASWGQCEAVIEAIEPGHAILPHLASLVRRELIPAVDARFERSVWVDVHFDVLKLGIPARGASRYQDRAVPFELDDGCEVRVFDPETALLCALTTLNRDGFAVLIGYADVARILARETIDWDLFDDLVSSEGLQVPVYCALEGVVTTLNLDAVPHPRPSGLRAHAWRWLWRPGRRLSGNLDPERHALRARALPFLTRGRFRDALRSLRWWIVPPHALAPVYFPDIDGGYCRRVILGRWQHLRGRGRARPERPARAALDQGASPGANLADG